MNIHRTMLLFLLVLFLIGTVYWLPMVGAQGKTTENIVSFGGLPPQESAAPTADCTPDDSFENNDTLETAAPITPGIYSPLILCSGDPNDYFAVNVPAGHTIQVDLSFASSNRFYALSLTTARAFLSPVPLLNRLR